MSETVILVNICVVCTYTIWFIFVFNNNFQNIVLMVKHEESIGDIPRKKKQCFNDVQEQYWVF